MLQRTADVLSLTALVLTALLTGCQGNTETSPMDASAAAEPAACNLLGPPTVVRYRTDVDERKQEQIQLFNGNRDRALLMGCTEGAPLASVVTLRYRIVES